MNAIYELRDTELSFHNDLRFTLDSLRPLVSNRQTADLLFGGLDEIDTFSSNLHEQLEAISQIETRTEQCMKLYKLFLDQLMTLRDVYSPYCARQSQVMGSFFFEFQVLRPSCSV